MFNSNLILATFSPSNLFNGGEQGLWLDPSDFSTMFQDSAGSTPVTAVGDPVGLIRDKSGKGNHASQATSTKRPVLQQDASGRYYLLFDGVDDAFVVSSFAPGFDKVQLFFGVRDAGTGATGTVVETSASSGTNAGAIASFVVKSAGVASYSFRSRGTLSPALSTNTGSTSPITNVVTDIGDISGDNNFIRVNGVAGTAVTADQGTGNYLSYAMYIGARNQASLFLNGRLYGLIVRYASSNLSSSILTDAETWMNGKTGAY